MSKINKLREYLLENYLDEMGNLNIIGLDFSEFEGDVIMSGMKVKGDLHIDYQEVKGDLWQDGQTVQGDLYNRLSEYGGELYEYPSTKLLKK